MVVIAVVVIIIIAIAIIIIMITLCGQGLIDEVSLQKSLQSKED